MSKIPHTTFNAFAAKKANIESKRHSEHTADHDQPAFANKRGNAQVKKHPAQVSEPTSGVVATKRSNVATKKHLVNVPHHALAALAARRAEAATRRTEAIAKKHTVNTPLQATDTPAPISGSNLQESEHHKPLTPFSQYLSTLSKPLNGPQSNPTWIAPSGRSHLIVGTRRDAPNFSPIYLEPTSSPSPGLPTMPISGPSPTAPSSPVSGPSPTPPASDDNPLIDVINEGSSSYDILQQIRNIMATSPNLLNQADSHGNTALMYAANKPSPLGQELVQDLLPYHPDLNMVNQYGNNALMCALIGQNASSAQLLVKSGERVFSAPNNVPYRNIDNETPLTLAAKISPQVDYSDTLFESLLQKSPMGAQNQLGGQNNASLMSIAIDSGNLRLASKLFSYHYADPNISDKYGNNAMHHLVLDANTNGLMSSDIENLMRAMLTRGNPNNRNNSGYTLLGLVNIDVFNSYLKQNLTSMIKNAGGHA